MYFISMHITWNKLLEYLYFYISKRLLHTIFCLFLKSLKAFIVSLTLFLLKTLTIITKNVFRKNAPLNNEKQKLYYDWVDTSEDIGDNTTSAAKNCIICHYGYFFNKGFKFQPVVC